MNEENRKMYVTHKSLVGDLFPTQGLYLEVRELYNQTSMLINPTMPWPEVLRDSCKYKAVLLDKVVNSLLVELEACMDNGPSAFSYEESLPIFQYIGYIRSQLQLFHFILKNEESMDTAGKKLIDVLEPKEGESLMDALRRKLEEEDD